MSSNKMQSQVVVYPAIGHASVTRMADGIFRAEVMDPAGQLVGSVSEGALLALREAIDKHLPEQSRG